MTSWNVERLLQLAVLFRAADWTARATDATQLLLLMSSSTTGKNPRKTDLAFPDVFETRRL